MRRFSTEISPVKEEYLKVLNFCPDHLGFISHMNLRQYFHGVQLLSLKMLAVWAADLEEMINQRIAGTRSFPALISSNVLNRKRPGHGIANL